jgi:hypothetical protein
MYFGLHVKYLLFLSDLVKLEIFMAYFQKNSNIKFRENPSNGKQVVPRGWTDRQDEADSHFWQFCKHA